MIRKLVAIFIVLIAFSFSGVSELIISDVYAQQKPASSKKTKANILSAPAPAQEAQQPKSLAETEQMSSERWTGILPNATVVNLVFDPASDNTLYALIKNPRNSQAIEIYKSLDNGITWEHAGLVPASRGSLYFDKRSSSVMYFAGSSILKSTDSGKTWHSMGFGIIPSVSTYGHYEFAQDQNDPKILFIRAYSGYMEGYETFKSMNDGKTWGKLLENPNVIGYGGLTTRDGFLLDGVYYPPFSTLFENRPINVGRENWGNKRIFDCRDNFTIFAIKSTPTGTFYGRCHENTVFPNIYVTSNDNGKSWKEFRLPEGETQGYTFKFDKILSQEGFVFGIEDQQEIIYSIFGYDDHGHNSCFNRIYKSKDDGNTWEAINKGLQSIAGVDLTNGECVGYPSADAPPHLVMSKSGVLYLTLREGGIYKSTNNGNNWELLPGLGLPTSGSYTMVVQKDHRAIYAYSGDVLLRSLDGGLFWTRYKIVRQSKWDALNRLALSDGNVEFTDWKAALKFWDLNVEKIYQDFQPTQFAVSPVNTKVIYIISANKLLKSEDGGLSWSNTNLYAEGDDKLFIDEGSPDTILVLSKYNAFTKGVAKDGDISWYGLDGSVRAKSNSVWASMFNSINEIATKLEKKEPRLALMHRSNRDKLYYQVGNVKSISHFSKNLIAVTNGLGGAYISTDGGETWKMIFVGVDGGMAKAVERYKRNPSANWNEFGLFSTNHITVNAKDPKVIYISTERGVFRSLDGGKNWNVLNNGLQNLNVKRIVADDSFESIFAETDNGTYRLSDKEMTWTKVKANEK